MNYVIGCGGVGSWLAPSLAMLVGKDKIHLVDGDAFEAKNLARQLFDSAHIGMNKAQALALKLRCAYTPEFFADDLLPLTEGDWLLVCVDNNPARNAAMSAADMEGCQVIFAANEKFSSEAYYYRRAWRGTGLDPRRYYPMITDDHADDPRARAMGCTGDAQIESPQLVSANFSAASLLQNLYVLWALEAPKLDTTIVPNLPYRLRASLSRLENNLVKERIDNGR